MDDRDEAIEQVLQSMWWPSDLHKEPPPPPAVVVTQGDDEDADSEVEAFAEEIRQYPDFSTLALAGFFLDDDALNCTGAVSERCTGNASR